MFSIRTLTVTGIIIVLLCAGLLFYTGQINRNFAEHLTTRPSREKSVENRGNKARENVLVTPQEHPWSETQSGVKRSEIHTAEENQRPKSARPAVEGAVEALKHRSQDEIDTVFEDAFAFLDDYTVFDAINIEATREALAEMLAVLHGDDPRISEFLGYWDTSSLIFSLRAEYRKAGARDAHLREQIFEMKPTEMVPKAFELGSELMQPSETVATQRSEWLQNWVGLVEKAETAHFAGLIAKEAFEHGEITAEEVESFIEDVSGTDVKVHVVEE